MSRPTPFDLAFSNLATERFPGVRDEALDSATDVTDRAQFAKLPTVQRLFAEVAHPALVEQRPDAADEYLTSLYVAYRFWAAGCHVVAIDHVRLKATLASARAGDVPLVPRGACYLQLPERVFWAQIDHEAPHEPLDGVFVTLSGTGRELTILAVLGLRPERRGFSQLVVRVAPPSLLAAADEVRTPPFAPVPAGGEAAGLMSLVSVAELLHLVQLALRQVTG